MKTLAELIQVPPDMRDLSWENQFFQKSFESPLRVLSEEPIHGPDGWPYLLVQVGEKEGEDSQKVLSWLRQSGIGVAMNPAQFGKTGAPELVVNWGGIWHYCEKKKLHDLEDPHLSNDPLKAGIFELENDQTFFMGNPSQAYLPNYVRDVLREFFVQQEQKEVRVCMISKDQKHYDLAFAVESLGNPPQAEHEGILEAVSWFLPSHYGITLLPESNLQKFFDL